MKNDIFYKSININNYSFIHKPINIRFQKASFFKFYKLKFKNSITKAPISSIFSKDLFFDHFSLSSDIININSFQPSIFFDSSLYPDELLCENNQKLMQENNTFCNYLKTLNFFGSLKQKMDKTLFLDVDDALIKLVANSLDKNIKKECDFNILIISKNEYEKKEVFPILEIDHKFKFKIKGLSSIIVNKVDRSEKIWFLEIESKDLKELRYKYHLSPSTNAYSFLIKIG
jgi:hypothetical protein